MLWNFIKAMLGLSVIMLWVGAGSFMLFFILFLAIALGVGWVVTAILFD